MTWLLGKPCPECGEVIDGSAALSLLDRAISLAEEYAAQWGGDYLAEKWRLPRELEEIREARKALG